MNKLYPYEIINSVYQFDFKKLHAAGINAVIFDIDNTLVEHGAPADKRAVDFFNILKKMGLKTCLLSNNKIPRVEPFAEKTGSYYIADAKKPSVKNYLEAMKLMSSSRRNTAFFGDQIFTDIYGANKSGIRAYLVKPIHPKEEIQIVLKRKLEAVVLFFYRSCKKGHNTVKKNNEQGAGRNE